MSPGLLGYEGLRRDFFQGLIFAPQKDPGEPRFKGQGPRGRGYVLATKDWAELVTFFVGLGSTFSQSYKSLAYVATIKKILSQKKNFCLNPGQPIFVSPSFWAKRTCPWKNPEEKTRYKKNWSFWVTRRVYLIFGSA